MCVSISMTETSFLLRRKVRYDGGKWSPALKNFFNDFLFLLFPFRVWVGFMDIVLCGVFLYHLFLYLRSERIPYFLFFVQLLVQVSTVASCIVTNYPNRSYSTAMLTKMACWTEAQCRFAPRFGRHLVNLGVDKGL